MEIDGSPGPFAESRMYSRVPTGELAFTQLTCGPYLSQSPMLLLKYPRFSTWCTKLRPSKSHWARSPTRYSDTRCVCQDGGFALVESCATMGKGSSTPALLPSPQPKYGRPVLPSSPKMRTLWQGERGRQGDRRDPANTYLQAQATPGFAPGRGGLGIRCDALISVQSICDPAGMLEPCGLCQLLMHIPLV